VGTEQVIPGLQVLTVSPNPTTDFLTVDLQSSEQDRILIVNQKGQILREIKELTKSQKIDVRDLPSALYHILLVEKGQVVGSSQFIKLN